MNFFYDWVIAIIGDAGSILIFGPGKNKEELKRRLKECKLDKCITSFEAVDKMTYRQIAARVQKTT